MNLLRVCAYVLLTVHLSRTQESENYHNLSTKRFVRQNADFFQDVMTQFQRMNDQMAQQWFPTLSQISESFQQQAPLLQQMPMIGQSLAQSILSSSDSFLDAFSRSNDSEDDEESEITQAQVPQTKKEDNEERVRPKRPFFWHTPLLGLQSFIQNPPPPFNYNPFVSSWSDEMQQASASDISEVRVKPETVNTIYKLYPKTTQTNKMSNMQNYKFSNEKTLKKNLPLLHKETQAKLSTPEDELIVELKWLQSIAKLANQMKSLKPYDTKSDSLNTLRLGEISVYKVTIEDIEKALKDEDVLAILHTFNQHRHTIPSKRQVSSNDFLRKFSAEDLMKIIGHPSRMSSDEKLVDNNWMKIDGAQKSTEPMIDTRNMRDLVNEASMGRSVQMMQNPMFSYWPGVQQMERKPTVNPSPLPTQWPQPQLKQVMQTGTSQPAYWMDRALTQLPQRYPMRWMQSSHMFEPKMRQQQDITANQQSSQELLPAVNTPDDLHKNGSSIAIPGEIQSAPQLSSTEIPKISQAEQVPETKESEPLSRMNQAMLQPPQHNYMQWLQSLSMTDSIMRGSQNDFPVMPQSYQPQMSEVKRTDTINPEGKPKKKPISTDDDSNRTGLKTQIANQDDLMKNEKSMNLASHLMKTPENARHSSNLYGTVYDNYNFLYYPEAYFKSQYTKSKKSDQIPCPLVVNNYYGDCSTTPKTTTNQNSLKASQSGHGNNLIPHLSFICTDNENDADTDRRKGTPVTAAASLYGADAFDANNLMSQYTHTNVSPYKMAVGDDEILKMLQENKALPSPKD
uniref:DEC-1 protein N-terminal domain-containing protein n=1 Tax=Glossina brevipalpis TaxID=37001 RepID=A0A1A9WGV0_9MUSC